MKALFKLSTSVALVACISCGGSSTPTRPASGSLAVTISGLPAGTNASVTVTGPNNFNQVVTATQTLTDLTPGNYTVTANNVMQMPYSYGGNVSGSPATISTSAGANATVTYAAITGAIQLTVIGTPTGTNPSVTVTGPGGFNQVVTGSQVLGTLVPGTYTINVTQVRASGSIVDQVYTGTGGSAAVAAGATATGAVTYSLVAGTGKLWVALFGGPLSSGRIVGYDSSQLASSGAPTPSVTIATGQPYEAVVFDRAHDAWTIDSSNTLARFTPSQLASSASPTPEVTISGPSLSNPLGLAFDSSNNAWVANYGASTLVEFTAAQLASSGAPTANVEISAAGGLFDSLATLAFDRTGNLWVASQTNNNLLMFAPALLSRSGSPTPSVILSSASLNSPVGLAFDSANNLWVSNYSGNTVVMFTAAQRTDTGSPDAAVILTGGIFSHPSCIAFDNGGNLWVVNVGSAELLKFTPAQIATSGSPTATTTITGLGTIYPELGWCSFSPAPAALPLFH